MVGGAINFVSDCALEVSSEREHSIAGPNHAYLLYSFHEPTAQNDCRRVSVRICGLGMSRPTHIQSPAISLFAALETIAPVGVVLSFWVQVPPDIHELRRLCVFWICQKLLECAGLDLSIAWLLIPSFLRVLKVWVTLG